MAVSIISQEVRLLQSATFKVSTPFVDLKGGFDNVNANQLTMSQVVTLKGRVSHG